MFAGHVEGVAVGSLTVRGTKGSVLWGYRSAADFTSWTIARPEGHWQLLAVLLRVDRFAIRQRPLLFAAPRQQGFWCWAIESIDVGDHRLLARLGPPEQ